MTDQPKPKRRLPTWHEMNQDTTPEAEAILFQLWREMPAWRKIRIMTDLNKTARHLSMTGIRRRHPHASPEEVKRRYASIVLGEELAEKVYGPLPEEK